VRQRARIAAAPQDVSEIERGAREIHRGCCAPASKLAPDIHIVLVVASTTNPIASLWCGRGPSRLSARFEMGARPLPCRRAPGWLLRSGGDKLIVVADHCAES
jgi:hypothetical protein